MSANDKKMSQDSGADRRSFLKFLGLGAAASGAAIASGAPEAAAAEPPAKDGELYRETQHVKTYYELAKF